MLLCRQYFIYVLSITFCFGIVACDEKGTVTTYTAEKEDFIDIPTWDVPNTWQEIPITHTSQLIMFKVGSSANASLSLLMGNGGGSVANINRWRRQLSLMPLTVIEAESESRKIGNWILVKLLDEKQEKGTFGAIYQSPKQTLFAKLSGNIDDLNNNAETFLQFITSIKNDAE